MGHDSNFVRAFYKRCHPPKSGRKVLAVACPGTEGFAIEEKLGRFTVGVHLDHLRLAWRPPPNWPRVAIDVGHWHVRPIGLEDEVGLLLLHVASDESFLIDAWGPDSPREGVS